MSLKEFRRFVNRDQRERVGGEESQSEVPVALVRGNDEDEVVDTPAEDDPSGPEEAK